MIWEGSQTWKRKKIPWLYFFFFSLLYLLAFTQEYKKRWTMKIGGENYVFQDRRQDNRTSISQRMDWEEDLFSFSISHLSQEKALVMKFLCSHGRVYKNLRKKPGLWNQERDPNVPKSVREINVILSLFLLTLSEGGHSIAKLCTSTKG